MSGLGLLVSLALLFEVGEPFERAGRENAHSSVLEVVARHQSDTDRLDHFLARVRGVANHEMPENGLLALKNFGLDNWANRYRRIKLPLSPRPQCGIHYVDGVAFPNVSGFERHWNNLSNEMGFNVGRGGVAAVDEWHNASPAAAQDVLDLKDTWVKVASGLNVCGLSRQFERGLALPYRYNKHANTEGAQNRGEFGPIRRFFGSFRRALGRDGGSPLSAQIGGVVILSVIAGIFAQLGIGSVGRRRWCSLVASVCLLLILGLWVLGG